MISRSSQPLVAVVEDGDVTGIGSSGSTVVFDSTAGNNEAARVIILKALSSNTVNLRVGTQIVTTSRGLQLRPGDMVEINARATIHAIAESGSGQGLSKLVLGVS